MWTVVLIARELAVLKLLGIPTADVLVLACLGLIGAPIWCCVVARLGGPGPAPAAPETALGATTAESPVPAPANVSGPPGASGEQTRK